MAYRPECLYLLVCYCNEVVLAQPPKNPFFYGNYYSCSFWTYNSFTYRLKFSVYSLWFYNNLYSKIPWIGFLSVWSKQIFLARLAAMERQTPPKDFYLILRQMKMNQAMLSHVLEFELPYCIWLAFLQQKHCLPWTIVLDFNDTPFFMERCYCLLFVIA